MVGWEQSIGVKAVFCAAVASINPIPALAMTVEECSSASDIDPMHEFEGGYEDFGNSLVAFEGGGSIGGGSWGYVDLVRCRSGETLSVDVMNKGSAARRDEAWGVIRDMVASPDPYSLADVKAKLIAAGFAVELTTADAEICACKALYPSERHGKTPYVFEPYFEDAATANGDDE
ncbi:MAG: hypothetical protein JNN02_12030 [Tabrizicola sp.]|nr:hypothetical protein [Tabrizicola sp.]